MLEGLAALESFREVLSSRTITAQAAVEPVSEVLASVEATRDALRRLGRATEHALAAYDPRAGNRARALLASISADLGRYTAAFAPEATGSAVRDRLRLERAAAACAWAVDVAVELADAFHAGARASKTTIQLSSALRMPRRGRPLSQASAPLGPRALEATLRGDAATYGDPRSVPGLVSLALAVLVERTGAHRFFLEAANDGPDARIVATPDQRAARTATDLTLLLPNLALPAEVAAEPRPSLDEALGALAVLIGAEISLRPASVAISLPAELGR